jgi:hypothetical protein
LGQCGGDDAAGTAAAVLSGHDMSGSGPF